MQTKMDPIIENSLDMAFSHEYCRSFFKLVSIHPDMSALNLCLTFDRYKENIDIVAGIGEWEALNRQVKKTCIPGEIIKPSLDSNGNICFTKAYIYSYEQTIGDDYFDLEIRNSAFLGKGLTSIIDVLKHFDVDVDIKDIKDKPYDFLISKTKPFSGCLYLSDKLSEKDHDLIMVRVFLDILYLLEETPTSNTNSSLDYEKTLIMFCICSYFGLSIDEIALKTATLSLKKGKTKDELIDVINHISYMYNLLLEYIKDESYLSSDALVFLKIAIFKSGIEDETSYCLKNIDKQLEDFLKLDLDNYYKRTISTLRKQLEAEFSFKDISTFLEFKQKVITNQIKGFPRYIFHFSKFNQ